LKTDDEGDVNSRATSICATHPQAAVAQNEHISHDVKGGKRNKSRRRNTKSALTVDQESAALTVDQESAALSDDCSASRHSKRQKSSKK